MNPKYRPAFVLGVVLVLMVPYLGFVVYYSSRFPPDQLPAWFTNIIAVWFIVNFLTIMLVMRLSRGLSKNQPVDAEKARVFAEKAVRHGVRLLMFWGLLFLYGAVQTLRGKFPLERAIPAVAFLLFFIGLFGWALYRAKRSRKPNPLSD